MKKNVKSIQIEVAKMKKTNAETTKSLTEIQSEETIELRQKIEQLSIIMSELMIKIVNIDTEDNDQIKANYPYFKCDVCNSKFKSQIKLKTHINMKHPIKMPQTK